MLISRYSDTATVIKREANTGNYLQSNDRIYSESKPLSESKLADLLDTSGFILAFYHRVYITIFFFNILFLYRLFLLPHKCELFLKLM